jgi:hypothetical protein
MPSITLLPRVDIPLPLKSGLASLLGLFIAMVLYLRYYLVMAGRTSPVVLRLALYGLLLLFRLL